MSALGPATAGAVVRGVPEQNGLDCDEKNVMTVADEDPNDVWTFHTDYTSGHRTAILNVRNPIRRLSRRHSRPAAGGGAGFGSKAPPTTSHRVSRCSPAGSSGWKCSPRQTAGSLVSVDLPSAQPDVAFREKR